jgi:integrase
MSDSSPVACARAKALIPDAGEQCALRWGSFAASLTKRVTGLVFLRLCARKEAIMASVATPVTLESCYLSKIRPSFSGTTLKYVSRYDFAVGQFSLFRGGPTPIGELCGKLIELFTAWLQHQGHSTKSAENITGCLHSVITEIDRDKFPPTSRPVELMQLEVKPGTLLHFFERVYWPRKNSGRSDSNRRLYLNALANFGQFLGQQPQLTDLLDENISECMAWMVSRGRQPETANKVRTHLVALWNWAAKKGHVSEFPTVGKIPAPQRIPRAWLQEELERIFISTRNTPGKVGDVPAALWWTSLLLTMWYTLERVGALLRVTWDDYDETTGWLLCRAEIRKGGLRDKSFPLPPCARELLQQLRAYRTTNIFQWPSRNSKTNRSTQTIYYNLNKILKRAGLPTGRFDKFHRIRKSGASHLLRAGGNAAQALGHTNMATTAKYLDPRIVETSSPAELLFNPLGEENGGAE